MGIGRSDAHRVRVDSADVLSGRSDVPWEVIDQRLFVLEGDSAPWMADLSYLVM